jgi:hypothetical protein
LLGSEATVLFRTFQDVASIVKAAPFKGVKAGSDVKLYVAFLSQRPRSKPKLPLRLPKEALEAI